MNFNSSVISAQKTGRLHNRSFKRANNTPLATDYSLVGILPDERIYIVGGGTSGGTTGNAYLGTVSANNRINWIQASNNYGGGAMSYLAGCTLSDGRIVSVCGYRVGGGNLPLDVYLGTPTSNTINWVQSTNFPAVASFDASWSGRWFHTCTLLKDGRIIVIGGYKANAVWNGSDYIFYQITLNDVWFGTISGNSISWVQGTSLPESRCFHGVSLLPDGRIAVIGGITGSASQVGSYPPAPWDTSSNFRRTVYLGAINGNTINWTSGTDIPNLFNTFTATGYMKGNVGTVTNDNKNRFFLFCNRTGATVGKLATGIATGSTIDWTISDFGTEFRNTVLENNEEKLLFSLWPISRDGGGGTIYVPSRRRFYLINPAFDVNAPDVILSPGYPDGARSSIYRTSSVVYTNCI